MALLRTLLNWWAWTETVLVVILGTPVVALVWAVTAPFDPGRYAAGRAFRLVGVAAMRLNGLWRFRTRGHLADPRRPYVVVANHESYADVFLISCFPWEMKWLSKDTMFRIPCMGWMMRMAGDISLVRGKRESAIDAINQCRDRLRKRVSVMIFPEGTRSPTGEMLPFKDGAFRLAIEQQLPILPIAVAGTRHAMAKGTFRFQPARALAQALEPIETTGMTATDLGTLKALARERIEAGRVALQRELGIARLVLLLAAGALGAGVLPVPASAQQRDAGPSAAEFAARRAALAARIGDGVVVAFGARTLVHDFSGFFQLPSFRYLTDCDEPDAAFVMVVRGGTGSSTLYLAPVEARRAFYYGAGTDTASALARYGIPARGVDALAGDLDALARSGLPFHHVPDVETTDFAALDTLTRGQATVRRLSERFPRLEIRNALPHVLALRARKSEAELALLRRAIEITAEGHRAAITTANPQHEYELKAALEAEFTRRGAERPAYGSIVGAGANAGTLHYMRAAAPVRPGDLVLMDAGAEYRGYAADVTRTIPASGTYSPAQRAIYQLVLDAQKAAERNSRPGMSIRAAADSSVAVRVRGLAALGLIEDAEALFDPPWRADCDRQPASCRQSLLWMIHGITHGIGLAVHDPLQGTPGDGTFQPGDAFTIEPGIYVSTRSLDVLPDTPRNRRFIAAVRATVREYEQVGVRIEDSYVIGADGLERVSRGVPREIDELEALMRQRPRIQP